MNYWLIKEKPTRRDLSEWGGIGHRDFWVTKKPAKAWLPGDRLFFWLGSPKLSLIRLGVFDGVNKKGPDKLGQTRFYVRYLTGIFNRPLQIGELRAAFANNLPSFLKAGPAGTVFPLTQAQAWKLYGMVVKENSELSGVWPDVKSRKPSSEKWIAPDVEESPQRRGLTTTRIIRDTARSRSLKEHYSHRCQVCRDRIEISTGLFYSEVHHVRPLGGVHRGVG